MAEDRVVVYVCGRGQGLLRGDQDFNRLMNPEDDVEEDEDYKLRRSMFEIDEHF